MDSTPQVLARIPSLASELPEDDPVAEGAGESRLLGSRASLKILAAVGGALFLLALWGFVFDRNKSKEETEGPVSSKEPFRPEVPAPNAPEAPRWAGLPSGTQPGAHGGQVPISAEARPVPPDATAAGGGPWMEAGTPAAERDPRPWTLSQGSSAPASPAWNGQDAGRSEPVPDWTTQPYPSTADRTRPPAWDMQPAPSFMGSPGGAPRQDVAASDAAAGTRSAVNPVYRDDRDPARAAPAAYTDPALGGSRWPATDSRPADAGQSPPASSNRPVSLAQRPSLERQLPAPPSGASRELPGGGWNWNAPAESRATGTPGAGNEVRRGPGEAGGPRREAGWPFGNPSPSDHRAPVSSGASGQPSSGVQAVYSSGPGYSAPPGAASAPGGASYGLAAGQSGGYGQAPGYGSASGGGPGAGYAPAGPGGSGPAVPWNQRAYGLPQSAPGGSPTPPSNPYHNLLPMYQAPASSQPGLPAMPRMDAYRSGALPGPSCTPGQGPVSGASANPPAGNAADWPSRPTGGAGSPGAPWGGSNQAPGGVAYPPSYSLPVTR